MKEITKAVIPAAGLGTRMLPIARAVPKEMLPIVDRPAISYLVQEAVESGITDILIITNRGKGAIEDYFDYSVEYEEHLRASGKDAVIPSLRRAADCANITFIRQKEARGLGHAIQCARAFTGDEPFLVLYGDDVIFHEHKPVCRQLMDAFAEFGKTTVGVKEVSQEQVLKYCSLDAKRIRNNLYDVRDMIEKPRPEQVITRLSILGRVLLTPDIYPCLSCLKPGAGGELQLTDAMRDMARREGAIAVDFDGVRYDMGSKLGFLQANVERAVRDPELGEAFRRYLRDFVGSMQD